MKINWRLNDKRILIGGFLMTVGAGFGAQLPEAFPAHAGSLRWAGVVFFLPGLLLSLYAFFDLSTSNRVYEHWDQHVIDKALRDAPRTASVAILQTSFPNAAELIPHLRELLVTGDKRFRIRLLLANPYTKNGRAVIAARMRLRAQDFESHCHEIEDHIHQFEKLKADVEAEWAKVDDAKLNLEIRLYDHLPFGPQFHIGKLTFVGFFVATASSVTAPMVRFHQDNPKAWKVFDVDFDAAWKGATPLKDVVDSPE